MEFAKSGMQTNAQMAADMAAGQAAGQQAQLDAMQNIAAGRQAEVNANVVNKLIVKDEYAIAAEVLSDEINAEMSRADIDGMIVWIEKLAAKLRGAETSLEIKTFNPPDPDEAYEKVKNGYLEGMADTITTVGSASAGLLISLTRGGVAWKNDAQRVLVANTYLDKTNLMSADEAQKELVRFDAVKSVVEKLSGVVVSRCKIESDDLDHYIAVRKSLSSIKARLKANRTRFLSYEVVSPYLYEAHCHLFAGISDDWRVSSFNHEYPKEVKDYRMKGVKLLAKACHKEWLYMCSEDVRDQFLEIQQFMKKNVQKEEYEEYKVITTLSDCNDPNKVRGADAWWK